MNVREARDAKRIQPAPVNTSSPAAPVETTQRTQLERLPVLPADSFGEARSTDGRPPASGPVLHRADRINARRPTEAQLADASGQVAAGPRMDRNNDRTVTKTETIGSGKDAKQFQVQSYNQLFGSGDPSRDSALQQNRGRLVDGYFDGAVRRHDEKAPNVEAGARVARHFESSTEAGGRKWSELLPTAQQAYVDKNRVGLWNSLDLDERAMFLSNTKALSEIRIADGNNVMLRNGKPVTALDFVESVTDIHGGAAGKAGDRGSPSQLKGNPNSPDGLDAYRLGVTYTGDGQRWLQDKAGFFPLKDDGTRAKVPKSIGRAGLHSEHDGFKKSQGGDWAADGTSDPNLQWQFRGKDRAGEIDLDYDHRGLHLKANTKDNSNVLAGDHLPGFNKKFGDFGMWQVS